MALLEHATVWVVVAAIGLGVTLDLSI